VGRVGTALLLTGCREAGTGVLLVMLLGSLMREAAGQALVQELP
jgi:hypothetical protein